MLIIAVGGMLALWGFSITWGIMSACYWQYVKSQQDKALRATIQYQQWQDYYKKYYVDEKDIQGPIF